MHKDPDISFNSSRTLPKPTIQGRRKGQDTLLGQHPQAEGEVPKRVSSKPCKRGEVAQGMSRQMGRVRARDACNVICGCLCRRRAVPVMDAISFNPFLPLFCFFLLLFLFIQGLTGGHCLGVVTRADSVTHKYFHSGNKAGS
jgi:hypothetical protein